MLSQMHGDAGIGQTADHVITVYLGRLKWQRLMGFLFCFFLLLLLKKKCHRTEKFIAYFLHQIGPTLI